MSARCVVALCAPLRHEEAGGEADQEREEANENGGQRQGLAGVQGGRVVHGAA